MESNVLEQKKFIDELNSILENIGQNEIMIIVKNSFNQSLKLTILSKKKTLKDTKNLIIKMGKNTTGFVKGEIQNIRIYGIDYIPNILPRLKDASIDTKDSVIETINDKVRIFKAMSMKDKKGILISGILWSAMILAVGGGTDFEGGVPDLDIKTGGIGNHRNVFSHTILVGLSLEFFLRLTISILRHGREYLPNDKSKIWQYIEELADIIDSNENILISGMWLGLSIHLLKDANIGGRSTKPYVGMPMEMSMESHQNIFAGNSFLSFIFGREVE